MFQKVTIVGNLGGDPDLRYTPQGDPVCNFNVATNRRWKGQDGQDVEETVWFRVTVWGKQAESCNSFLSKGRQVLCEGRLTPDKGTGGPRIWTDNEGNARSSFDLRAFEVKFLGSRQDDDPSGSSRPVAASSAAPADSQLIEDEIPF